MDEILGKKISEMIKGLKQGDISFLKELGGQIAEIAYIRNDKRLVNLIVISYSIAKSLEKHYVADSKEWVKFSDWLAIQLQNASDELKNDDSDEFFSVVETIVEGIRKLSDKTGKFQISVIEKAKLKAGTQIYAHGASLSTAAAFADVDKSELIAYINATKLPDKYGTISVKERMKIARALLAG